MKINQVRLTTKATAKASYILNQIRLRPNISSRNALLYSLGRGDKYDESIDIVCDGQELKTHTLFGENAEIYFMLLREYYGNKVDKYKMDKVISYHIDQGLEDEQFINILKGKL